MTLGCGTQARRGAGGRRAPLHCGGRRVAATALRCSLRGATSTTRPHEWVKEVGAKGGNGRALLDDARALIQQYDR